MSGFACSVARSRSGSFCRPAQGSLGPQVFPLAARRGPFKDVRNQVANGRKADITRTFWHVTWLIPTNQVSQARSAIADGRVCQNALCVAKYLWCLLISGSKVD